MMKTAILSAIRWYQRRGGSRHFFNIDCNFEPSCSEYTYQAITHYGVRRGLKMGWRRIRRCNNPDCVHKHYDPVRSPHDTTNNAGT
ncbi:MAG: alpha-hemolysin [Idiomarina sp.]|uniref:membrane protein insertion efficiency factor YidD n=1 Tax=Idiomarina sp. TaxID=1874361 RepID=UPI000C1119B4|nr:membrane protein insertion efficiency factor YidD [Idiomarina sp.]MBL4742834.1 membrane protein insertion efficiency factor YidD [Idiomarina sp.]MBT43685.1 alpha-hemolysin [Idiomarina sp.]PHQ73655.1 MAG: alpha-hemolysin [Idiomarina sp.]